MPARRPSKPAVPWLPPPPQRSKFSAELKYSVQWAHLQEICFKTCSIGEIWKILSLLDTVGLNPFWILKDTNNILIFLYLRFWIRNFINFYSTGYFPSVWFLILFISSKKLTTDFFIGLFLVFFFIKSLNLVTWRISTNKSSWTESYFHSRKVNLDCL